jgi:ferredoxin
LAAKTYSIVIEDSDETVTCYPGEAVLKAVARLGRKGIPVGCLGGGCGICKVRILCGNYRTGKMSREQVSLEEEAERIVLACRTYPMGDLRVKVLEKMRKLAFA